MSAGPSIKQLSGVDEAHTSGPAFVAHVELIAFLKVDEHTCFVDFKNPDQTPRTQNYYHI